MPVAMPPTRSAALDALARHYAEIPLTRAMGLGVVGFEGPALKLEAPLPANVNDKGCAFGGSLVSLMTLAGWGWIAVLLEQEQLAADVFVKDSTVRYLAPVWQDFVVLAEPALAADAEAFLARLREHGKAGLAMSCRVPLPAGGEAATLTAVFVAIARP